MVAWWRHDGRAETKVETLVVADEHDEAASGCMRGSIRAFPASSTLSHVPALRLNPTARFRRF